MRLSFTNDRSVSEPSQDIADKPSQGISKENATQSNLNGKPYYSEENGFACAEAVHGVPGALPEHIVIIVSDERLEVEVSWSQLQSEIKLLEVKIAELEEQKRSYKKEITEKKQALAAKRTELTELETELEAPMTPELDSLSETTGSISELRRKTEELERDIEHKTAKLLKKRTELAKLKAESETSFTPIFF